MAKWIVTEIGPRESGNRHLAYHVLSTGSYRESMTFNGFFHGTTDRNYTPDGRLYYAKWRREWLSEIRMYLEIYGWHPRLDSVPLVKHNSIWDFYQAIGYDYKKKKYI